MNALTGSRVFALRLAVLPAWLMSCLLHAKQPAPQPEEEKPVPRHAVVPDKELLITSSEVTESVEARYPGALSFGYLMEQLAGRDRAPEFTNQWLRLWLRDQEVNRDTAPARPRMEEVLETWRRRDQDGGPDNPLEWSPNLANAPFKLIAVVNRMDLLAPTVVERIRAARENTARQLAFLRGEVIAMAAPPPNKEFTELSEIFHRTSPELFPPVTGGMPGCPVPTRAFTPTDVRTEFLATPVSTGSSVSGYGASASPFLAGTPNGEGRLVYALTDAAGKPVEPGFNVIFEYQLPGPEQPAGSAGSPSSGPHPAITWASRWHRLGTHKTFDDAYLRDLVAVTKGFTDQRPPRNSSERYAPPSLAQIRTNDGVLDAVREFREFQLVPGTQPVNPEAVSVAARLRQVPVAQTPAERYHEAKDGRVLAMVLNTRLDEFRKEAPVTLPVSLRLTDQTEPEGLLGARALLPGYAGDFEWKVSGVREKGLVRHMSLHTCNGCHGGDTNCDNGCHLKAGGAGTLTSAFLTLRSDGRAQGEVRDRATILKALLEAGERDSDAALVRLLHKRHRGTH